MELPNSITIKATIIPAHALRMIEFKIPLMRCKCWHRYSSSSHRRPGFDYFSKIGNRYYFSKIGNRYYMRNPHGKKEA